MRIHRLFLVKVVLFVSFSHSEGAFSPSDASPEFRSLSTNVVDRT